MSTNLIIDASVITKLLLVEVYSEQAHTLLSKREQDPSIVWLAPDIVYSEIANALWKRVKSAELLLPKAQDMLSRIIALPVYLISSLFLVNDALKLTQAMNHRAIYDCLYLALAIQKNAKFITADQEFCNKVKNSVHKDHIVFIADAI